MARPTIKLRMPVKFPANITAVAPLTVTKTGANYNFTIDANAILGGPITVFQLRRALRVNGRFFDVDNAITVDPGGLVYEAWTSGGIRTNSGDDLYDAIVLAIGAPAADAAYALAQSIIL